MKKKLIENTGVQFFNFDFKIKNKLKINWIEGWSHDGTSRIFHELIQHEDNFFKRKDLVKKGCIDGGASIINHEKIQEIQKVTEFIFTETNVKNIIKCFMNKWIPIPVFKDNGINQQKYPKNWIRIMINSLSENNCKCTVAVDTSTSKEENNQNSPFISENKQENIFKFTKQPETTLNFCQEKWISDYIKKITNTKYINEDNIKSRLNHLAFYNLFIRNIDVLEIEMLGQNNIDVCNIDMVVDIGNSRTCVLLSEETETNSELKLDKVEFLEIVDMSNPSKFSDKPFSTNLVFNEVNFGDFENIENNKFIWPSLVRIGDEAEKIINNSGIEINLGYEKEIKSYNSSPKRYLWDNEISDTEWEFLNYEMKENKTAYLPNVCKYLTSKGSLIKNDEVEGLHQKFSRRSLMTFVFLEILCQAYRQVNSIKFRENHGKTNNTRKIKNIIISCPTSMIKEEQIALREAANNAIELFSKNHNIKKPEIAPSLKDIKLNLDEINEKKDWNYDEATSSQIVYIYGMITHNFNNNCSEFFKMIGRGNEEKSKIRVASVDIGGGTTDLMIAEYSHKTKNKKTTITPDPLFWETFNLAGDDLLKELIQQIIIEGNEEEGGAIEKNYRKRNPGQNAYEKLNNFFGKDSNNIGHRGKVMRKSFINQIAIPLMMKYMEKANNNENEEMKYGDIFIEKEPNKELLKYFRDHFGFNFKEITWKISSKKINNIITKIFEKLIVQISKTVSLYTCDILILSGKSFSFDALEDLFIKHQGVLPNRIINMNKYLIGRWYPFADGNGKMKNQKPVVAIGSLISFMASKNRISNFNIDNKKLCQKLISNANYIGNIKNKTIPNNETHLNIEDKYNQNKSFKSTQLPCFIGFKKIKAENYPARNLYVINFNEKYLKEKYNDKDQIKLKKQEIRKNMPINFEIERDLELCKEKINLISAENCNQEEISTKYFEFKLNTIENNKGYWLDEGEFVLNIE